METKSVANHGEHVEIGNFSIRKGLLRAPSEFLDSVRGIEVSGKGQYLTQSTAIAAASSQGLFVPTKEEFLEIVLGICPDAIRLGPDELYLDGNRVLEMLGIEAAGYCDNTYGHEPLSSDRIGLIGTAHLWTSTIISRNAPSDPMWATAANPEGNCAAYVLIGAHAVMFGVTHPEYGMQAICVRNERN